MKYKWLVVSCIGIVVFQVLIYTTNITTRINWLVYDYFVQYTSKENLQKTQHIAIVEIDEKSLKLVGQWPWPRVMTAQLLKKIAEYKPQSITMDVLFVESDRTSLTQIKNFYLNFFNVDIGISGLPEVFLDNDAILADAISRTNTILPIYLTYHNDPNKQCEVSKLKFNTQNKIDGFNRYQGVVCSLPQLEKSSIYKGFMNSYLDSDGRYRRVPLIVDYNGSFIPSLSLSPLVKSFPHITLEPAKLFLGDYVLQILDKKVVLDSNANVLLNFYPRESYTSVSAFDLLSGNVDPNLLLGKHIFVGTTAEGIQNLYNVAEDKKLPGIHTHATFIENFFNNELRIEPSSMKILMLIVSIILSLSMLLLLFSSKFLYAIVTFLFSFIAIFFVAYILMSYGVYISFGYFLFPYISTFILLIFLYTIINFVEQKNFYKNLSNMLEKKVKERTQDLKEAKERVELLHQETQDSINFALFIQKAILPDEALFKKYFQEYFVLWQPRDTIGGDIYFLEELKKDEEVVLFVIDCTSHGVPGALVTILVKAVEQQIVAELLKHPQKIDPSYILQEFNKNVKKLLNQYDKDSVSDVGFDGGIVCYNKKSGRVLYAGANTTLYTIQEDKVKTYKGDRHPIGYIRSNPEFIFKVFELDSKTVESLYLSTDGYLDQKGGEKGFPLGRKHFTSFVESNYSKPFDEQYTSFSQMIKDYKGDHENTDDMTLVGLKF